MHGLPARNQGEGAIVKDELMVEIVRWGDFQHYKNRRPLWVKNYLSLIHNEQYRKLTPHQRAVLHGLWILYAASGRQLTANTASLSSQLGLRVSSRQLESLSHAGFIEVLASSVLAQRRVEESRKTLASSEPVDNNPAREFQLRVLKIGNEEAESA